MLSFTIINYENYTSVIELIAKRLEGADLEYMSEICLSLLQEPSAEYALALSEGCLAVRIFDGEYSFIYPTAICDRADECLAAYSIREYAVKEEIPLRFVDVPREELGRLLPLFRHATLDAQDSEGEYFGVGIISELSALGELDNLSEGEIALDMLKEEDDSDYARLCKDKETGAFWGYDYSADVQDPCDSYFRHMAENEFARGVALALAVRRNNVIVGEASLYGFDLVGGCQCAVRILPEYRGRGYAATVLRLLGRVGGDIGLLRLYATVDSRNDASRALCDGFFDEPIDLGEKLVYSKEM